MGRREKEMGVGGIEKKRKKFCSQTEARNSKIIRVCFFHKIAAA